MLPKTARTKGRKQFRSSAELRRDLLKEIERCEQRAHQIGMHATAHALNNSKNACGWEMAGNLEMARKASKGLRAGEPAPQS
jgi:hypothetical protein